MYSMIVMSALTLRCMRASTELSNVTGYGELQCGVLYCIVVYHSDDSSLTLRCMRASTELLVSLSAVSSSYRQEVGGVGQGV